MNPSVVFAYGALETTLTQSDSAAAFWSDPANTAAVDARLNTLSTQAGPGAVLSLDVFDTLFWRDDSSELTRFLEVGARMARIVAGATDARPSPEDCFVARDLGNKASYRLSEPREGWREGRLQDIHRVASRLLIGDERLTDAFVAAELDNEPARLTLNSHLAARLNAHRAVGGRAVLMSDMYLSAAQITDLLQRAGLDPASVDMILSSADETVSKAHGGLLAVAEQRLETTSFVHVGDSLLGDYQRPKQRGWRALHLPIPEAAVARRRADHAASAARLAELGLTADVAEPR